MSEQRTALAYEPPTIRDYGRLSVVTAFDGGGLHFAQISVGSLPGGGTPTPEATTPTAATPPATGTQGVLDTSQAGGTPTTDIPDSSGVKDTGSSSPAPASPATGVESGSDAGGAGSGSGTLPFTGTVVGPVAALGAGLAAAGAALRRHTRRT